MNSQATSKRSACDRCKAQRLRCLRAGVSTDPCARCIRAGTKCLTGPAGRLGRPRKATVSAREHDRTRQNPPTDFGDHAARSGVLGAPGVAGEPMLASRDESQPVESQPANSQSVGAAVILSPRESRDQMADIFGSPGVPSSPPEGIDYVYEYSSLLTMWEEAAHSAQASDFQVLLEYLDMPESLYPSEGIEPTSHRQSLVSRNGPVDFTPMSQNVGHRMGANRLGVTLECASNSYSEGKDEMPRLACVSRLSERISMVISDLISMTRDAAGQAEPCFMLMDQLERNPLAQALLCSEEFIKVVRGLPSSSPYSEEPCEPAASDVHPWDLQSRRESLSMPTLFLVLSIYSQLRHLFELLICHIHRLLMGLSSEVIKSTRIRSVIRLGGLPPMYEMQANTFTRIVVHVMQDHVQNMERHMGLIARYCRSYPDTRRSGLFAMKDLDPILHRLIDHANGAVPKSSTGETDSLQQNIQKIFGRLGGD